MKRLTILVVLLCFIANYGIATLSFTKEAGVQQKKREQIYTYLDTLEVQRDNEIVDSLIHRVSKEDIIPMISLIYVESRFNKNVVSLGGDYGLTQVNFYWHHKQFDFKRMIEVDYNLLAGYSIYQRCKLEAKGDLFTTLKLYNGSSEYPSRVFTIMRQLGEPV